MKLVKKFLYEMTTELQVFDVLYRCTCQSYFSKLHVINYLLISLVRSVLVKYRTSIFAQISTRCACLGPHLKITVRYFTSTDLKLGQSIVNFLISQVENFHM